MLSAVAGLTPQITINIYYYFSCFSKMESGRESEIYQTIQEGAMDGGYYNISSTGEHTKPIGSDTGDYLTILESPLDDKLDIEDKVYEKPEPHVTPPPPTVYETLQTETTENPSNQRKSKSNRITIIILVVIGFIVCAAVGAGVGWYFGSQKSTADEGKPFISECVNIKLFNMFI